MPGSWMMGLVWFAAVLSVVLLVLLVVLWQRRRQGLEDLWQGIAALAEGRAVKQLRWRHGGLSKAVADQFNRLAPSLQDRIARLESDREQLQAVLSGMSEGVLAVDGRRRLVFANAAAQRLLDLSPASVGQLVPALVRSPQLHEALESTLQGQGAYRDEVVISGRERLVPGQERYLALRGTPLAGRPVPGAVLVLHDVTELRRLERMRQDFVANASHELKTPLASIKVNTETLLEWAAEDEKVRSMLLKQIDEQVDRLNALVHDMLQLAKLESGQEAFRHAPLEVQPIVRSCVGAQHGVAEARRIRLELNDGGVTPTDRILAHPEALRQILGNLVDNAIKYTPDGGRIVVSAKAADGELLLTVADTGMGIPREDLPRIFERFYRVDRARSRALGGTGLGLSIVKHLTQVLGGQVSVESRLGVGSTFTVRLPLLEEARESTQAGPDGDA